MTIDKSYIPESMNPLFAGSIMVSVLRYAYVGVEPILEAEVGQPADPYESEIWVETCSIDIAASNILNDYDYLYPEVGESEPDNLKPMTWVFKFIVMSDVYQETANTLLRDMNILLNNGEYIEGDTRVMIEDLWDLHKSRFDRFYTFDGSEDF